MNFLDEMKYKKLEAGKLPLKKATKLLGYYLTNNLYSCAQNLIDLRSQTDTHLEIFDRHQKFIDDYASGTDTDSISYQLVKGCASDWMDHMQCYDYSVMTFLMLADVFLVVEKHPEIRQNGVTKTSDVERYLKDQIIDTGILEKSWDVVLTNHIRDAIKEVPEELKQMPFSSTDIIGIYRFWSNLMDVDAEMGSKLWDHDTEYPVIPAQEGVKSINGISYILPLMFKTLSDDTIEKYDPVVNYFRYKRFDLKGVMPESTIPTYNIMTPEYKDGRHKEAVVRKGTVINDTGHAFVI